jgi:hypothetical protein
MLVAVRQENLVVVLTKLSGRKMMQVYFAWLMNVTVEHWWIIVVTMWVVVVVMAGGGFHQCAFFVLLTVHHSISV